MGQSSGYGADHRTLESHHTLESSIFKGHFLKIISEMFEDMSPDADGCPITEGQTILYFVTRDKNKIVYN